MYAKVSIHMGGVSMKKILIICFIVLLVLTGCSATKDESDNNQNAIADKVGEENIEKKKDEQAEVKESEIGKLTIFKKNEEVEAAQEIGPFIVKINKMQVAKLETSEDYKSMFDDKDAVTILALEVEVENKSTETNSIYPDQGTIVTNTKEQKDAHIFLSDDVVLCQ